MTQEEKQLLLKDLCARLPYNVIVSKSVYGHKPELYYLDLYKIAELQDGDPVIIKPYLRPILSMTKKEHDEYSVLYQRVYYKDSPTEFDLSIILDWLNAHHFDYRGLIPMGLALEAPDGMYKAE